MRYGFDLFLAVVTEIHICSPNIPDVLYHTENRLTFSRFRLFHFFGPNPAKWTVSKKSDTKGFFRGPVSAPEKSRIQSYHRLIYVRAFIGTPHALYSPTGRIRDRHVQEADLTIILCTGADRDQSMRLEASVKAASQQAKLEICKNIEVLLKYLRHPNLRNSIVILMVENKMMLERIHKIGKWFYGCKLILILPDSDNQTIAMGHSLGPRYLSYMGGDFSDVAQVLKRMLEVAGINQVTVTGEPISR